MVPHTGKKHVPAQLLGQLPVHEPDLVVARRPLRPQRYLRRLFRPQGDANYANIQVTNPKPGTWTAVFFTQRGTRRARADGHDGKIKWRADTWIYGSGGTIKPVDLDIAPGATQTTSSGRRPRSSPATGAIDRPEEPARTNTVPVTVRALVRLEAKGGSFKGLLSGGNGRGNPAQMNTYAFDVPSGNHDVDVSATFGRQRRRRRVSRGSRGRDRRVVVQHHARQASLFGAKPSRPTPSRSTRTTRRPAAGRSCSTGSRPSSRARHSRSCRSRSPEGAVQPRASELEPPEGQDASPGTEVLVPRDGQEHGGDAGGVLPRSRAPGTATVRFCRRTTT